MHPDFMSPGEFELFRLSERHPDEIEFLQDMFPAIPNDLLFGIIDKLLLPVGFWRRVEEEPSWHWCRTYLLAFLCELPDDVFENTKNVLVKSNDRTLEAICDPLYDKVFKSVPIFRAGPKVGRAVFAGASG